MELVAQKTGTEQTGVPPSKLGDPRFNMLWMLWIKSDNSPWSRLPTGGLETTGLAQPDAYA